jgi:4'-phosphopantetheinyl transferase
VSQQTGQLPEQLVIRYGSHGKPFIRDSEFHFNLSHSQDHALLAIAVGREVGIDVECVDESFNPIDLVERFLSVDERKCVLECPTDQQRRAFLRRWVRKEAMAKATGIGIAEVIDAPLEHPINCDIRDIDLGTDVAVAAVALVQKYS